MSRDRNGLTELARPNRPDRIGPTKKSRTAVDKARYSLNGKITPAELLPLAAN